MVRSNSAAGPSSCSLAGWKALSNTQWTRQRGSQSALADGGFEVTQTPFGGVAASAETEAPGVVSIAREAQVVQDLRTRLAIDPLPAVEEEERHRVERLTAAGGRLVELLCQDWFQAAEIDQA